MKKRAKKSAGLVKRLLVKAADRELSSDENAWAEQKESMDTQEEGNEVISGRGNAPSGEADSDVLTPEMVLTTTTQEMESDHGPYAEVTKIIKELSSNQKNTEILHRPLNGTETSYLCDADFRWLKGDANERAIFWVWLYLKHMPFEQFNLPYDKTDPRLGGDGHCIYSFLSFPATTGNTAQRSGIIISFFEWLSRNYSPEISKAVFEHIRATWANLVFPVRQFRWLKKTDELAIEWAWDYLLKKKEMENNILTWFKPVSANEAYIAIMGSIDYWFIRGNSIDCLDKKRLLEDMYRAFKQRTRREKSKKFILNAEISLASRRQLKILVERHDVKINKFIESLIDAEYQRYKSNTTEVQVTSSIKKK